MDHKLDREGRMTLRHLAQRGHTKCEVARLLGVTEGTVRYHLKRLASGAVDGRARQAHRAESFAEAIGVWLEGVGEAGPINIAALHEYLVRANRIHDASGDGGCGVLSPSTRVGRGGLTRTTESPEKPERFTQHSGNS